MKARGRTITGHRHFCRAFRVLAVFVGLFASGLVPLPLVLGVARPVAASEETHEETPPEETVPGAADACPTAAPRPNRDARRTRPVAVALLPLPLKANGGCTPAAPPRVARSLALRC